MIINVLRYNFVLGYPIKKIKKKKTKNKKKKTKQTNFVLEYIVTN